MAKRGPKYKYTPEELVVIIDEYFNLCLENKKPYLISSLAYHLGVDPETLTNWGKVQKFSTPIKKAKEKIKIYAEEFLFCNNKTSAAIFNLKCNYGWKDVQEIKVDSKTEIQFKFGFGEEEEED